MEEIHQAYHDTEPSAPPHSDDTSSLPPYEKENSLYSFFLTPISFFVIMDGIGQEEIAPVPSFVIETDEEEDITTVRPKSVGPASRTRSKHVNTLEKTIPKLFKSLKQLSNMLEGVPRMSGAVFAGPSTSSPFLQPRPTPKKRHQLKKLD